MKKPSFKKILSGAAAVFLTAAITAVPASAALKNAAPIDEGEELSLTVCFEANDTAVEGAEITIYKVADIETKNGTASYTALISDIDYEGMDADESNDAAEDIADEDLSDLTSYTEETDEDGEAMFEDIERGMYLVILTNDAEDDDGTQYYFEPYLISVPYPEEGTKVYTWEYDVVSNPKSVSYTEEEESTTVSNTYGAIAIMKVDAETGEYLEGASFALYTADGTYQNTYTTNEEGWLQTYPISYGVYYFIETEAPDGYILDSTPIYVTLTSERSYSSDYPWVIKVANEKSESASGSTSYVSSSGGTTTYSGGGTVSSPGEFINQIVSYVTGDSSNIAIWCIVILASALIICAAVIKHKNKGVKE